MIAAAYIRVSSKAQNHAMQRDAIERGAKARQDVIGTWYAESASAKALERPELDRLRRDVRNGIARRVYVFKLDRLTRSGVADTFKVVEEITKAGAELVAVADNIHTRPGREDLTTDVLIFALALAAKIERVAINDRIAAARVRLEAAGIRWGRPMRADRGQVARVLELAAAGGTVRGIAVAVGLPPATVGRMIKAARPAASQKDAPKGGGRPPARRGHAGAV